MTDTLKAAQELILTPAGLSDSDIAAALAEVAAHQCDYADVFCQWVRQESWVLEDGIVKDGTFSIERGVGVRAVTGEKSGFAYADEISAVALQQSARTARTIARAGGDARLQAWRCRLPEESLYQGDDPLQSIPREEKVALLKAVDERARRADPRVKQVIASLSGVYEVILVAGLDGTFAGDIRPLVRLNVSVVVEENGKRESANSGGGGRRDYSYFLEDQRGVGFADEAVRQALVSLSADPAPAGTMTVVLGPGWPGVLLHEAVGHGLEGDFNRKGTSAFSNRLGQQVASDQCTVVDNGAMAHRRGSLNVDDEGTPTRETVLIENGILKNYMQDRLNARLMNSSLTGNGRRESYAYLPMPRMTNTYMLPGKYDPEEIIASVDKGMYAVNFGGGQVDITSGKFVFSASEAYLIENGRVTRPVKGAMLIGSGPEAMTRVSMVGNDLALDAGVGTCGKDGQSVPVGVGQPTLRIDGLTVGGTSST